MRISLIAALLLALSASAADRTQEILDTFAKTKHVNKQKRGVTKAVYVDQHGEAAAPRSGTYAVDGLDFALQLEVAADGVVRGSGEDHDRGAFTLRDGRVRGSLLTATKVYTNGATSPLEGVFMELVSREGTAPENAQTSRAFGLGVIPDQAIEMHGIHVTKLFYARGSVPRS